MRSVPRRANDPSTALRMFAALLSNVPGPSPARETAELGRDHDLVAASRDRPADDLLAVEGTVDLSRVEMGDAELEGAVDGADRLIVVQSAALV